jgi:hypothetical protein
VRRDGSAPNVGAGWSSVECVENMASDKYRPDPADLRVFRLDTLLSANPKQLSYTVPEGRALIINSWVCGRMNSSKTMKLLRNDEIVAERVQMSDQAFVLNLLFPTGIAFLAGDTFTIDSGGNGTVLYAYGYEEDV